MDTKNLIGMRVRNVATNAVGTIKHIQNGYVEVDFYGDICKFLFPSAFTKTLELEDEMLQEQLQSDGVNASFTEFKKNYSILINNEIEYLKEIGGKKYKIIDGKKIMTSKSAYIYSFDTDIEMHYPDNTLIKLWFPNKIMIAYIISCDNFTIFIRIAEDIGDFVKSVEFTSEQWQLLEALTERINDMQPRGNLLAYEIACNGRKMISHGQNVKSGQNLAFNRATSERITFIWGPPGTGKTEVLSNIALEHIKKGRRVLMLSYSNVSVDGALLRVAQKSDFEKNGIVRYGYPRTKELIEDSHYTSYQIVLHKNPELANKYQELSERKKKLKKRDPDRLIIDNELKRIRQLLSNQEKELVHKAAFVATTVSKATVDKAIYMQKFDVVIFDEASMAYVPQIVFAAGMAKSYFICLGDFCQLSAVVQNKTDNRLVRDIFQYTGITSAVENNQGHEWLVMLDTQYRMHYEIANFVSKYMYHSKLKTSEKIYESRNEIASMAPCEGAAMSLIDLSGMFSVCTKTKDNSRINLLSALICMRIAEKFIGNYEVGIITPYSAQSRLILSMLRDIQSVNKLWLGVSCATVHQFQGSEKPVIIYDAVDCYRMSYPGVLLTSQKNDTADRLFNVALTRAKGKFILVANTDYLIRKNISRKLMFTKSMYQLMSRNLRKKGLGLLDELMPLEKDNPTIYVEDRETSWSRFIKDIQSAQSKIHIDIPDVIDCDNGNIDELIGILNIKQTEKISICIRKPENINLPESFQQYEKICNFVTTPVTIIDGKVVWFGQPLYSDDFISEGEILDTEYFPCVRFEGNYSARLLQSFLEI